MVVCFPTFTIPPTGKDFEGVYCVALYPLCVSHHCLAHYVWKCARLSGMYVYTDMLICLVEVCYRYGAEMGRVSETPASTT